MPVKIDKERKLTGSNALRFPFAVGPAAIDLVTWYHKNSRSLPWRELFKKHGNAYHIWISEIMLQQTVIKAVLPVYDRFLQAYPTIADLAATDEETLRLVVRGLGYYRRFGFLLKAAKVIQTEYKGRMPVTFDEWKSLPGIGDYTAAAISSIAFGESAAVVDGNVERVFCRLLDIRQPPNLPALKKEFQRLANSMIYREDPGAFNQGLMELGQTVCTAGQPDCSHCPLAKRCLAKKHSSQALAPAPKIKKSMEDLAMRLHVYRKGKQFGLIRRPVDAKFLGGTRGFLTEVAGLKKSYKVDGSIDMKPVKCALTGSIRHHITHHRITAEVYIHDVSGRKPAGIEWLPQSLIDENLVSNLDRKAWRLVEKKFAGMD